MSKLLPPSIESKGVWDTPEHYYYEIVLEDKKYFIQMCIGHQGLSESEELLCNKINELYPATNKQADWKHHVHFVSNKKPIELESDKLDYEQKLDDMFKEAMCFERDLIAKLRTIS